MCGIFAVLSPNEDIFQMVTSGLKKLQNRGYDSVGVGVLTKGLLQN